MQPLDRARHPEATALLVRAFDEDPFFRYLAPEPAAREAMLEAVMRSNVAIAHAAGRAQGIVEGSDVRAVCLGFPPGTYPPPPWRTLGARAASVLNALRRPGGARLLGSVLGRALRMDALMADAHPRDPFHYLLVLAVDPRWQGHGHGGAAMRAVIGEADRRGCPAILETSKPANVGFYRRFGFEIVRATRVDGSPPVWTMRRAPASTGHP